MKIDWKNTILPLILLISLVAVIRYFDYKDNNSLASNGMRTVGIITDLPIGGTVKWRYTTSQGESVEIHDKNAQYIGIQTSEKFYATYDTTYYKNAVLHYDEPYIDFESDTLNNFVITRPMKTGNLYISYKYRTGNQEFLRQQRLPKRSNWEKEDSLLLIVNKDKPAISYIIKK